MKVLLSIIAINVINLLVLLLSEAVTVALITGSVSIIASTITALIALAVKNKVNVISTNIDGMRSNELKVTKELGESVGAEAGRQKKREEDRADKIDSVSLPSASHDPIKVTVEQPKDVPLEVVVAKPADVNIIEDKTKRDDSKDKK